LRAALDKGGDPQAERDRQRTEAAPAVTFKYAVAQYIAAHKPGGSNEKHAQQLENTLATYAYAKVHCRVESPGTQWVWQVSYPWAVPRHD